MVRCHQSGKHFFFALQAPAPPANLIGGVFSGSAIHDASARPVACRILLIRDRASERAPAARPTYMPPSTNLIAGLLVSLGYDPEENCRGPADRFGAFLMERSGAGLLDTPADAVGTLGFALDSLGAMPA
ncbi:hypothetical protein [Salinarimonas soli]|uniref:Uncharacterized protein n=1 Tax=Salinarimonas soli TaxID=1638099 RepID=A0A5B2V3H7_9HYPH|nr:hypothetical protein [Salinarimonas soli]KAA2233421.1 hypothetical protein F0L46_24555 [Salinarimonas soli]